MPFKHHVRRNKAILKTALFTERLTGFDCEGASQASTAQSSTFKAGWEQRVTTIIHSGGLCCHMTPRVHAGSVGGARPVSCTPTMVHEGRWSARKRVFGTSKPGPGQQSRRLGSRDPSQLWLQTINNDENIAAQPSEKVPPLFKIPQCHTIGTPFCRHAL